MAAIERNVGRWGNPAGGQRPPHRLAAIAWGLAAGMLAAAALAAEGAGEDALPEREAAAIRAAVDHVADAVVQIRTVGGLDEVDQTVLAEGPTTGLILSPDGWIISSSYNFLQQPASILVMLPGGQQAPAELVAHDHNRKLALLKISGVDDLPAPELLPSDETRVGQWAIAVGRTFQAERPNVSVGIVSARNRVFGKVLQTDADVSTANYGGPLIDIRGRVIGLLVPIAPQSASEVAGAEWYDSGIGFAVPLADISHAIEQMKQGEDQRAGLLGISMPGNRPHETAAELALVLPNSPASQAGLRKGDRIVEIAGQPIATQTDLRFALGRRYAGDDVTLVVQRGNERVETTATLAGQLESFRHSFLGILPIRTAAGGTDQPAADSTDHDRDAPPADENGHGVLVRKVYAGSPAAEAAIREGDRVVRIGEAKIDAIDEAIAAMNAVWPGSEVAVELLRDGQQRQETLRAAPLPGKIPSELPPAYATDGDGESNGEDGGETRELKLAEFSQDCRVYVPRGLADRPRPGVLLWIHAPGEPPTEERITQWQAICDRDNLLLVLPTADDPSRWERTELEYLRRLTERVVRQFEADPHRVAIYGARGGGAMAYLLALASRDLVSGVATSAAALPRTVEVPTNEPNARLAVLAVVPSASRQLALIQADLAELEEAGYEVVTISSTSPEGELTDRQRQQLARWIDTLDRF